MGFFIVNKKKPSFVKKAPVRAKQHVGARDPKMGMMYYIPTEDATFREFIVYDGAITGDKVEEHFIKEKKLKKMPPMHAWDAEQRYGPNKRFVMKFEIKRTEFLPSLNGWNVRMSPWQHKKLMNFQDHLKIILLQPANENLLGKQRKKINKGYNVYTALWRDIRAVMN